MNRPLVIAHRGSSASAPENTIAAIREAIDVGVDCVEVDVRCTSDGVPVLYHDPAIGRTAGDMGDVSHLTLEQIREFDVGAWKGEQFKGERIPTFEEALIEANGKIRVVAEFKVDCTNSVNEILQRLHISDSIYFSAFRRDLLQKIYSTFPGFEIVWLLTAREWLGMNSAKIIESASESEIAVLALPHTAFSDSSVAVAHEMGLAVWVFECDEEEELQNALAFGADGIVTSYPEKLMEMIKTPIKK